MQRPRPHRCDARPLTTNDYENLTILAGVFFNLADVVDGDKARTGADVARAVSWREAIFGKARLEFRIGHQLGFDLGQVGGLILFHDGEHGDRDVALQVGLLVDGELDAAVLDAFRDVFRQVEGGEVDLALQAHFVDRAQRRRGRIGTQRQHRLRARIGAQVGADLALDDAGVDAVGVQRGGLVIDADRVGEATAALERRGVGRVVVDADEGLDAGRLGALSGAQARFIFGLADVHDGAQLFALRQRAGVDGDERDFFRHHLRQRFLQHAEVGDADDDAVVIARRGLLHQPRHVGQVAVRRIAVVDRDVEVFAGLLDGVLDGVPPRVRIGRVADQDEFFARGLAGASGQYQRQRGGALHNAVCKLPAIETLHDVVSVVFFRLQSGSFLSQ